ncbi:hypothetical protein F9L16_02660 [Agarivorans sp. B2Z047]|uniref:hypothetical protein n=1 Tax=Agarivorans sp. B2Z047 TaxID=2652721 RepID=UPI00128E08B1|nr:hypothetical protein [Agarivorans sp. B2Z047]MPW27896.1 hypothetical protein [Agarivorans sp. B2Z047]UQN44269.1 hypothetical protein LQZ07_07300 [Agarivorans sp. B2Z047]
MNKSFPVLLVTLVLSACAATRPTVEEVVASYHTDLNAPHKEELREKIVDSCSLFRYKTKNLEGGCYLSGDVIVHEYRLKNNRMEWGPAAAATITKSALKEVCEDDNDVLNYGFALLVNLEGKNGFVGKLKSYDDCLSL